MLKYPSIINQVPGALQTRTQPTAAQLSRALQDERDNDPRYRNAQRLKESALQPFGVGAGWAGVASQILQGYLGGKAEKKLGEEYSAKQAERNKMYADILQGYNGGIGGGAADQKEPLDPMVAQILAGGDPNLQEAVAQSIIKTRLDPKEKPEYETVNADGKVLRINKRDPNDRVEIGAQDVKKKLSRVEMVGPDGPGVYNVDDTTGEVVGKVGGIYNKPPSSVVNVNNSAEGAYQKKRGEDWATNAGEIYRAAQEAPTNIGRYDRFEALVASGIPTGKVSEMTLPARQALKELGIADDATISGQEEISALAANFTLTQLAALKGASSDRDLSWAAQSVANLGNTPEGNMEKIRIGRKAEQRKMEVARLAAEYEARNGQLDAGFQVELNRWAEQNPMFSAEDRQRVDNMATRRKTGASPRKPAADPLGLFE